MSIKKETQKFNQWLNTPLGQQLINWQMQQYSAIVPDIYGKTALQFGLPQLNILADSNIEEQLFFTTCFEDELEQISAQKIIAESVAWPLPNDCVDLVILPLTLNNSLDLASTLREAHRVLRPQGRLLLSANNILSTWGIARQYRYFLQLLSKRPPCAELLQTWVTPWHVKNWLHVLNFEINQVSLGVHCLPFNNQWLNNHSKWLDSVGNKIWPVFAAAYFIDASKRQHAPVFWRPKWNNLAPKFAINKPATSIKTTENHQDS